MADFGDANDVLGASAVLAGDSRTNLEVWDDAVAAAGATIVGGGPVLSNAAFLDAVDIYVNTVAGGGGGSVAIEVTTGSLPLKLGVPPLNSVVLGGVSIGVDPPETGFTWSSLNTDVATVIAAGDSATVTATGFGQTTITARGIADDTVTGSIVVRVVLPEWFDLCVLDDLLLGQYSSIAPLAGLPADADGDGVIDIYAVTALAYTLCDGSVGPDKTTIEGQYAANQTEIVTLGTQLSAVGLRLPFLMDDLGLGIDAADVAAAMLLAADLVAFEAAIPAGEIDTELSAGKEAALRPTITDAADILTGLTTEDALEGIGLMGAFGPFLEDGITELAAGFGGLSTSSQLFLFELLQLSAPLGPNELDDELDLLQTNIAVFGGVQEILAAPALAAYEASGTLSARLTTLGGEIGATSPTVDTLVMVRRAVSSSGIRAGRYSTRPSNHS